MTPAAALQAAETCRPFATNSHDLFNTVRLVPTAVFNALVLALTLAGALRCASIAAPSPRRGPWLLQHQQTDYNSADTEFDFTEANYDRVRGCWRQSIKKPAARAAKGSSGHS